MFNNSVKSEVVFSQLARTRCLVSANTALAKPSQTLATRKRPHCGEDFNDQVTPAMILCSHSDHSEGFHSVTVEPDADNIKAPQRKIFSIPAQSTIRDGRLDLMFISYPREWVYRGNLGFLCS